MMKKLLTIIALLIATTYSFGQQGFTYSYVDPCSKKLKTIYIQNNELVTVNYLGVIGTFNQTEFQNGTFSTWVQGVQTQVLSQPCDELKTQAQVTQNFLITQNIISTLTSITAASTMNIASSIGGASNSIGNSVDNSSSGKGPRNNNRRNNRNNQSNPGGQPNSSGTQNSGQGSGSSNTQPGAANSSPGAGNNVQGGSGTNTNNPARSGSGTSQPSLGSPGQGASGNPPSTGQPGSGQGGQSTGGNSGGSGTGSNPGGGSNGESNGSGSGSNTGDRGSGGSGGSNSGGGSGSGGQVGATDTKKPDESTQKQTESGGGNGGTTNSVSNAAEASGSNNGPGGSKVRVGSLIGTGDIVAIRSAEDQSNQFKGTMSMTKSNTNNTRAKGFLLNFTTSINNSNLTFYGAFSNKLKTNTLIVANSSMIDFNKDFFNTTTVLESKRFGKLSLMGGLNFTVGLLAKESFSNLSGVGGGFYPFKINKKVTGTILLLGVYSPYTKFYEGKWWDSGILLVPFTSWDYTISKNFKYNVSFSGTYQMEGSVLNYQVLTGGKILL